MRKNLADAEHLLRVALVAAVLLIGFLAIRAAVVPAGFGRFGHYRSESLAEIRARPIAFAGRQTCEACHDDIVQKTAQARHAALGCEACHGPLASHVDDPSANKAFKPDPDTICLRCHEADSAKPKWFPQVVARDHAGDTGCGACHDPHRPKG